MAGDDIKVKERTFEETPTWAGAVVCLVLLAVSILIEHGIHLVGAVSFLSLKINHALNFFVLFH